MSKCSVLSTRKFRFSYWTLLRPKYCASSGGAVESSEPAVRTPVTIAEEREENGINHFCAVGRWRTTVSVILSLMRRDSAVTQHTHPPPPTEDAPNQAPRA